MAKSRHIHVVLDTELEEKIRSRAEKNGISVSAEARDLLRRAVGSVKSEKSAGWWEGFFAAKAEVAQAIQGALADLGKAVRRKAA